MNVTNQHIISWHIIEITMNMQSTVELHTYFSFRLTEDVQCSRIIYVRIVFHKM